MLFGGPSRTRTVDVAGDHLHDNVVGAASLHRKGDRRFPGRPVPLPRPAAEATLFHPIVHNVPYSLPNAAAVAAPIAAICGLSAE